MQIAPFGYGDDTGEAAALRDQLDRFRRGRRAKRDLQVEEARRGRVAGADRLRAAGEPHLAGGRSEERVAAPVAAERDGGRSLDDRVVELDVADHVQRANAG